MAERWEGRVALVTGASRGIGAAVARRFAQAGAAVVLAARSADGLAAVAASIPTPTLVVPTDVGSEAAVADLFAAVDAAFGRLDYACNNAAGGGRRPTPVHAMDTAAWDAELGVGLRGAFFCLRAEAALMVDGGGGAIVNISSTAGHQGVAGLAQYVAAKHGLEGLTKAASLDLAAAAVRVNSVAPGPILTDALVAAGPAVQESAARAVPLGRIGAGHEVADAVVWLCSDAAAFITGASLVVDGGRLAGTPAFASMTKPL
jgi:NAD(P)-dependent dehydrogenase (short-subunit alcohol dehydrogenase family)